MPIRGALKSALPTGGVATDNASLSVGFSFDTKTPGQLWLWYCA